MNFISRRTRSVQRPASLALLAVMAATLLGAGTAVAAEGDPMPMVLQNVSLSDISTNHGGICNGGFNIVMKSASGPNNAVNYLNAAQRCGLKVIMSFPQTVNHELGRVYPSKVPYWVNLVKNHPALYGYLTVKEPSWNRLNVTEIRSIYSAFHKADPTHPVIAIFGDIPHFDMVGNRWATGMADILVVDWYPVETSSGGCSRTRHALHHHRSQALHKGPLDRRREDARDAGLADGPDPQEPRPALPQEAGPDRAAPAPSGPRSAPLPRRDRDRVPHLVELGLPA